MPFGLRSCRGKIKDQLTEKPVGLYEKYIQISDISQKCRFVPLKIVRNFMKLDLRLFKAGGKFSAFMAGALFVFFCGPS